MYRKRIFISLLAGWIGLVALSVYSLTLMSDVIPVSGAAVTDIKPLSDSHLTLILVFSVFVLFLVGAYFLIHHSKPIK